MLSSRVTVQVVIFQLQVMVFVMEKSAGEWASSTEGRGKERTTEGRKTKMEIDTKTKLELSS